MKKIKLKETQIENLVKKVIKENTLNEVGGYDDSNIMGFHQKRYINIIAKNLDNIVGSLTMLGEISGDVLDNDLHKKLVRYVNDLSELTEDFNFVFMDRSDDILNN